jgi:photosystem II stability/assembly factor-like uncharacterized protein
MSVARTTDCGTSWVRYEIGQAKGITRSIAVDPNDSDIVLAGGCEDSVAALYATGNGGNSWSLLSGITGDTVNAIAIDPLNANIYYCGTSDGVFKSIDWGSTWIHAGCSDVNSILVNPNSPDTVYAGTDTGVYISTDQGTTWTAMNNGMEDTYVYCLGLYPDNYLFAATNMGGMYRWDFNVGLAEKEKISVINPYTGPTIVSGTLHVPRNSLYRLYDITGREVDIACIAPGIYFLEMRGEIITKIVKVR